MKNTCLPIQENQQTPSKINIKRATPRHIAQLLKIKDNLLKVAGGKKGHNIYKGIRVRAGANISWDTTEARRE